MENVKPTLYKQWLAWQNIMEYLIDPIDDDEFVEMIELDKFQEIIIIKTKKDIVKKGKIYWLGLVMQTDGLKLDQGYARAPVDWREKTRDLWG